MKTRGNEFLSVMRLIDYGVTGGLRVNAFEKVRSKDQLVVRQILQDFLGGLPELRQQYVTLLPKLADPDFNQQWVSKRRLGHLQRCICSGDKAFLTFALQLLTLIDRPRSAGDSDYAKAERVLFNCEGPDAQLAWTIAPLLMAADKSFKQVMQWVATGDEDNPDDDFLISLKGLAELGIWRPFILPDRYDPVYRRLNPRIAPINTHPNYAAAQIIAQELIARKIV